jgi:hypothetical protein
MRDWEAIAKGSGLDAEALARVKPVLEALEREFAPLAASLAPELEPALEFRAGVNE